MNPLVRIEVAEDAESRTQLARAADRFVRSGLASVVEWGALDPDLQDAILAAREVRRIEEIRGLAATFADPALALAEFGRHLDGGKLAAQIATARAVADAAATAGPDRIAVPLASLPAEVLGEIGVAIEP